MNEFKSVFRDDIIDYLAASQGTVSDATLKNTRSILLSFDSLLADEGAAGISKTSTVESVSSARQMRQKLPATR